MENCIALAAYLAAQTVENGGEISSAEETAIRVCKSGGAEDINVFIIPNSCEISKAFPQPFMSVTTMVGRIVITAKIIVTAITIDTNFAR